MIIEKTAQFFKRVHPLEIVVAVAVVAAINYFYYPGNAGFLASSYNPYLFVIIFFSAYYGKIPGIFSLLLTILGSLTVLLLLSLPGSFDSVAGRFSGFFTGSNYTASMEYLFAGIITSMVLGEIRDSIGMNVETLKTERKQLEEEKNRLDSELQSVVLVNEEYQDRILGQQNSLISLYSTLVTLNSLDLETIYHNILDAVVKFSGAGKCSLWEYRRDRHELKLLAAHGWSGSESTEHDTLSDGDNLIGWVARNNAIFSVKMLYKYANLKELDNNQSIITVPITIENRVWGIINIEEMPFVKYNLYSEQLIVMISDLAAPMLGNAIRFGEITKEGEVHPVTRLQSINEMFVLLSEDFREARIKNLPLSLVLLELNNAHELLERFSEKEVLSLVRDVSDLSIQVSQGHAINFQYKETFQFALILPNMDYDGAAMFCLNLLEKHGANTYTLKNEKVIPEIILGYSSLRENHNSADDLIMLAENLLEMQKI